QLWFLMNLALLAACGALGAVAFWVAIWRVAKPIRAMTGAMTRLAEGDLAIEIPGTGRRDEVGEMAGSVQVFKDNALEAESLRRAAEEAEQRAREERRRTMMELADKFNAEVGEVVEIVTSASNELESTAQSMSSIAEETTRQSGAV